MIATYTINGPLNSSVQIGDELYFTLKTPDSGYITSNNFIHTGTITNLSSGSSESTLTVNFTNFTNVPGGVNYNSVNIEDYFLFFAKNTSVNLNRIKGYYADVLIKNDSTDKAELYTVGAEIQKSSK